jgi:hypothetical protein
MIGDLLAIVACCPRGLLPSIDNRQSPITNQQRIKDH